MCFQQPALSQLSLMQDFSAQMRLMAHCLDVRLESNTVGEQCLLLWLLFHLVMGMDAVKHD